MLVRCDPLSDMTADEVLAAMEQAGEKLEALREQYAFHNCVMINLAHKYKKGHATLQDNLACLKHSMAFCGRIDW